MDSRKEVKNVGHQKMKEGETIEKEDKDIAAEEDQTNSANNESKLTTDPASNGTTPSLESQVRQQYFGMAITLGLFPL